MSDKVKTFFVISLSIAILSLIVLYFFDYLTFGIGLIVVILSNLIGLGVIKLNELEEMEKRKQKKD